MAITLRQTSIDTSGKTTELSYQEMNNNLKSYYYSSSLSSNTLNLHFLSGSSPHAVDLSGISNTDTNIANTSLNLTGNRTLDLATNSLSIDVLQGETFSVTADNSATVLFQMDDGDFKINGLPNTETPLVVGYNSSTGVLSYYSTASFGGGSVDTGSLMVTGSVNSNTLTFTKGDGTTFALTVDTGSGGGSTSPGGSDGQVQYNNGGAFGGESTFTYDDTNNVLSIQGTTNGPAIKLLNSTPSLSNGSEIAELVARSSVYSADIAGIIFKGDGATGGGDYPSRIEFTTTPDGTVTPTTKFQIKNDGLLIADEYGSGTFTGTATKHLAVSASGEIIEVNPPAGSFTRPGSDTSITYDTYLASVQYAVDEVGTSPAAPNANGNVSIRYAVSNIGSNVDRIDVYKTDSGASDQSNTLENLAVSGSINLAVTGVGSHTELYRIVSVTDNTTYMSYAVEWESGDDAAFADTEPTMTITFDSDYEYELSTGYNRLLVTNNSNGAAQRFRMVKPASANAGDEVIVELKVNTSGQNVRPAYQIRNGSPLYRKIRRVYEVDEAAVSSVELDTNDVAIMRFQVNDLGSIEGLTLLGANQIVYA